MRLTRMDKQLIADHEKSRIANQHLLDPRDFAFERLNFLDWVYSCKQDSDEALQAKIDFLSTALSCASGKEPYTTMRRHYFKFASYCLTGIPF